MRRPGLRCARLLALVLLALTLGCAAPPAAPAVELPTPRPSPMEARTRDAAPVPLGAPQPAAGLFVRVDLPGLDDESDVVATEVGQEVHGRVLLGNYSLFHGFRVACLVDYRQTPCAPDAVDMNPGEEQVVPLALPGQPGGLHQLLVLVFAASDEHSDEASFRVNSRFMVTARRAWLQAGPSATLAETPTPPKVISLMTRAARQGFSVFQVSPGKRPLDLDAEEWLMARSGPDVALDFTPMLTNPRQSSVDYLILPFLDYELHPAVGGQTHFRVRQLSGAASSLSLNDHLSPGSHEFQVLAITSPYADRKGLNGRSPQNSVSASARVLIFVDQ